MSDYAAFLARKQSAADEVGRSAKVDDVHPLLHEWQAEIVAWAVRVGRAAVWADTGLGKTLMQLEWARLSGDTALVVAPLAVCQQTSREAARIGIDAHYVRSGDAVTGPGIWITNYEMVEHFDPASFDSVVLDEASILKQSDGKTRTRLIRHFADVPARLAAPDCSTPGTSRRCSTCGCRVSARVTKEATMSDWFRHLFLHVPRRHRWCACGDSRATGIHSAAECGPLPWGF